jgi:hypothetical protein
MTPCTLIDRHRRFGETCCLQLHDRRIIGRRCAKQPTHLGSKCEIWSSHVGNYQNTLLWDTTPCSLGENYQNFWGKCSICLQYSYDPEYTDGRFVQDGTCVPSNTASLALVNWSCASDLRFSSAFSAFVCRRNSLIVWNQMVINLHRKFYLTFLLSVGWIRIRFEIFKAAKIYFVIF